MADRPNEAHRLARVRAANTGRKQPPELIARRVATRLANHPRVVPTCHPNRPHCSQGLCKSCYEMTRNKDYQREYRASHLAKSRDYMLRWKLGIRWVDYERLLQSQGGVCAVCGEAPTVRILGVDHDHATGEIRGLLCNKCNHAIGLLKDDPARLRAAIAYLERAREEVA